MYPNIESRLLEEPKAMFLYLLRLDDLESVTANQVRDQLVYLSQGNLDSVNSDAFHSISAFTHIFSNTRPSASSKVQEMTFHVLAFRPQPSIRVIDVSILAKDALVPVNNRSTHAYAIARCKVSATDGSSRLRNMSRHGHSDTWMNPEALLAAS